MGKFYDNIWTTLRKLKCKLSGKHNINDHLCLIISTKQISVESVCENCIINKPILKKTSVQSRVVILEKRLPFFVDPNSKDIYFRNDSDTKLRQILKIAYNNGYKEFFQYYEY